MATIKSFEKIDGLICAPFTAFQNDGELNLDIVPHYADMLMSREIAGVFINGSTGEGHLMTDAERMVCLEKWMESTRPGFKVVVHVGTNSVKGSFKLAEHAQAAGAWAIATMAPTFPRISRVEDLVNYCREVAVGAPELPFYFYHTPAFSGVHLSMLAFLEAADGRIPNFTGIKYTHENLHEYTQCRRYKKGKFDLLHGQDETILAALALGGAAGCIGGTINYAAHLYQGIRAAFQNKDLSEARRLQFLAMDLINVVDKYRGNVVGGKQIMRLIGLDLGPNRTPFQNMTSEEVETMKAELEAIGFFDYWNPYFPGSQHSPLS